MKTILLICPNPEVRSQVGQTLGSLGYRILQAETGEAALELLRTHHSPLTIIDGLPPETDSLDLLCRLKEQAPETAVILISDQQDIRTAVSAMKLGAADYLTKPVTPEVLLGASEKVLGPQRISLAPVLADDEWTFSQSEEMSKVKAIVAQVANTDATVLIRGESGVGKGIVANLLHQQSLRRQRSRLSR